MHDRGLTGMSDAVAMRVPISMRLRIEKFYCIGTLQSYIVWRASAYVHAMVRARSARTIIIGIILQIAERVTILILILN